MLNSKFAALPAALLLAATFAPQTHAQTLTGQAAFTDYSQEHPGVRRHLTVADLPEPKPDESVDNGASIVPKPDNAWPQAPAGFKVELYAGGSGNAGNVSFQEPRLLRTAPNGDLFLADSHAGEVKVLRGITPDGHPQATEVFASGLDHPFGINFYPAGPNPKWVYIANTTSVVRFAYKSGDLKASGAPQTIVPVLPGYAQLRGGGHWTRDVVFSQDGHRMFVSVGSASNVDDPDTHPGEFHRADVLVNPHFASLELTFYTAHQFPSTFLGDGFAAEHGSWNRSKRSGYEVIRIPMHDGHATGEYEDFLTGFVTPDGKVWGRPVGVTVANDGSLFVTDDGSKSIWHVTYTGKKTAALETPNSTTVATNAKPIHGLDTDSHVTP